MPKASLNDLLNEQQLLRRELCKKSLYFCLQEFWSEISAEKPIFNWHIQYICEELEKVARRIFAFTDGDFSQPRDRLNKLYDTLINIPPGSTKSTICSIMFPVWCWMNDPTLRFITGSYADKLAEEMSSKSKDIIKSAKFKELFPDIEIRRDFEGKGHIKIRYRIVREGCWVFRNGGERIVTSPGGTVTGFHAHIIIIDDPIKPRDGNSSTGAAVIEANTWLKETMSNRKVNQNQAFMVMVMQRLCESDPSGVWLDEAKQGKRKLKHICIPAEAAPNISPKGLINFYKEGLFDPIRFPRPLLRQMEEGELGSYGYAGQMMQSPAPIGNGMFKVEQFEIIDGFNRGEIKHSVRYWDKANTMGAGCYTVGVLMHKTKDNKYIIEDVVRGQWSAEVREKIMKKTAELDGEKVKIVIEQEPGSGGKESAQSTIANLSGFIVEADKVSGDKALRADQYAVQVNNHNVMLQKAAWNRDFINEHRNFPAAKFKDQVDASSGAFNKMRITKTAGGWKI